MPVEIKELNIKISLDDAGSADIPAVRTSESDTADRQHAFVDLIVEKVLEILKSKTER